MQSNKTILAIDTTTAILNVYMTNGKDEYVASFEKLNHASELLNQILEGCKKLDVTLKQIDQIVVSTGPGSFTGIRVALATVEGIIFGRDVQVIPITTFEIYEYMKDTKEKDNKKEYIYLQEDRNQWAFFSKYENGKNVQEEYEDLEKIYDIVREDSKKKDINIVVCSVATEQMEKASKEFLKQVKENTKAENISYEIWTRDFAKAIKNMIATGQLETIAKEKRALLPNYLKNTNSKVLCKK